MASKNEALPPASKTWGDNAWLIHSKKALPDLNNWLKPPTEQAGEAWQKECAGFVYQIPEMQAIKSELNAAKAQLDMLETDAQAELTYARIADALRDFGILKGKHGLLVREYGAEVVTNAWLKMYETMPLFKDMLDKLAKEREGGRILESFHVAEAPGNFILAINHYLHNHYPTLLWMWVASSYRDLYEPRRKAKGSGDDWESNSKTGFTREHDRGRGRDEGRGRGRDEGRGRSRGRGHERAESDRAARENDRAATEGEGNTYYLRDKYGIIRHYAPQWYFGADGDGDITSPENLISFRQELITRFGDGVHLYTSDVKYVPPDMDYNEEENINVPVHCGHLIGALLTLRAGGCMMLKQFTFLEAPSISLLYLAAHCFERLLIFKPETSKAANSEIYVIGLKYRANLSPLQVARLLAVMRYVRFLNTGAGSPALFSLVDIEPAFLESLVTLARRLATQQMEHLAANIAAYKKYRDKPEQAPSNQKIAQEWIEKNKVGSLRPEDRLMRTPS